MRGSRRFVRFVWALIAATGLVTVGAVAAWTVAMAQHQHAPSMEGMQKPDWLVKLTPAARTEAIQRQLRGFETTMAEVAYRYTEMYWGGILGHSLQPGRIYDELAAVAGELRQTDLEELAPRSDVAVLVSAESRWGMEFAGPLPGAAKAWMGDPQSYERILAAFYRGLFDEDHRRRRDGSDGASARAAASSAAR